MSAEILAELARVKALFQLRAIETVLGFRDSGSDPAGLRPKRAQGEASQSGGCKPHRPENTTTLPPQPYGDNR